MKSSSLVLIVSLCASLASAHTLSLNQIAERVREHNPQLKAARVTIAEARARQLSAGKLSNPSLVTDWRTQSKLNPAEATIAFEQSFPLTNRLRLEKQVATHEVAAAQLEVDEAERQTIAEARELAVMLIGYRNQHRLREQQSRTARELATFSKNRAEAGEMSALDASQLELDAGRLDLEVRMIDSQIETQKGKLRSLLGIAPEGNLEMSGDFPAIRIPPAASHLERPDLKLSEKRAEIAETQHLLAQKRRWDDIGVGITGGPESQSAAGSGRQTTGFIGLRLSLPLPFWNRNQGQIAETAATMERVKLETEALTREIKTEAASIRATMQKQAALVAELREKLLPLASSRAEAFQQAFESGQAELAGVLRARDQHFQIQSALLDAERDFHLSQIRYESVIGAQLP
ncbi:MAG: TolC family protein [Verrucomicrobiaceae bacterium]|nr:TolC family protein [Verrucomicrobiaceae bacterium]